MSEHTTPDVSSLNIRQPIASKSGISYGARDLGDAAYERAKEGVRDSEKQAYEVVAAEAIHYIFTIKDDETDEEFSLFIGGGPGDEYSVPRCYCGSNNDGTACKHIFWLWDQVLKTAMERKVHPHLRWHFLQDGRLEREELSGKHQEESLHEIIKAISPSLRLGFLAKARGWEPGRVSSEEESQNVSAVGQKTDFEERMDKLVWAIQPSSALKDLFSQTNPQLTEDVTDVCTDVLKNFTKLVKKYAEEDAEFQEKLDGLLHPEFSSAVVLVQMRIWAEELFERLKNTKIDVEQCAAELRQLVSEIHNFWTTKQRMKEHAIFIAKLYTDILKDVISKDNNLFVHLVVQPQQKDMFLLRELKTISLEDILPQFSEALDEINEMLGKTKGADQYRAEFGRILGRLNPPQVGRRQQVRAEASSSKKW